MDILFEYVALGNQFYNKNLTYFYTYLFFKKILIIFKMRYFFVRYLYTQSNNEYFWSRYIKMAIRFKVCQDFKR